MTLEQALQHYEFHKDNKSCGTQALAIIALGDALKESEKELQELLDKGIGNT